MCVDVSRYSEGQYNHTSGGSFYSRLNTGLANLNVIVSHVKQLTCFSDLICYKSEFLDTFHGQ